MGEVSVVTDGAFQKGKIKTLESTVLTQGRRKE